MTTSYTNCGYSGYSATPPTTILTSSVVDLTQVSTSCWACGASSSGTQLTSVAGSNPASYYFPSYNFSYTYTGAIIGINNQSGSTYIIRPDANIQVQIGATLIGSTSTFYIASGTLKVFMQIGNGSWVQISSVQTI